MSNNSFTDSKIKGDLPYQNCNLIGHGSMAFYQEFYPNSNYTKVDHQASSGNNPIKQTRKVEFAMSSMEDKNKSENVKTYFQLWKQKSKKYKEVDYPIAVSNRLFKDSEIVKDLPCQHCHLIRMGSMACYTEFCPECGRIPPNQHRMYSFKN